MLVYFFIDSIFEKWYLICGISTVLSFQPFFYKFHDNQNISFQKKVTH